MKNLDENWYKEVGEKNSEFMDLLGDIELKSKVSLLEFEDPSDKSGVKHILHQKNGMSDNQRNWLKTLIARNGKKFKN